MVEFLNRGSASAAAIGTVAPDPYLEGFQAKINDRRDVKCQQLRNNQASNYGQTQRAAGLSAGAEAEGYWQGTH